MDGNLAQWLERAGKNNRMPQAILLQGKFANPLTINALEFSQFILHEKQPQNSPNFFPLKPQGKSRQISADGVREVLNKVYQTGRNQRRKCVLIEEAQRLQRTAANVLLKTLEEPPLGTFFLLTSTRPYGLLPTLTSRCMSFVLQVPEPEEVSLAKSFLKNSLEAFFSTPSPCLESALLAGYGLLAQLLSLLQRFKNATHPSEELSFEEFRDALLENLLLEVLQLFFKSPTFSSRLLEKLLSEAQKIAFRLRINLPEVAVYEQLILALSKLHHLS